ncbi:hypothetical protein D3C81_1118880 [compost metagenome]
MLGAPLEAAAEHLFEQGAAVVLGLLVHQAEQCCQRQAQGLACLPMGELLGRRVHVADAAIDIGGDHSIADRLQGNLRAFLFFLQGAGEGLALGQQFARTAPGKGDEKQRGEQVGDQQHPQQHARPFTQGIAEGFGRRGHAFIDSDDAGAPLADLARPDLAFGKTLAHVVGQHIQLVEEIITDIPVGDRRLHVADLAEIAVEPDDAVDVVGVIAALQYGLARDVKVWIRQVEHLTHLPITMRHSDDLAIALVGALIASIGIQVQVIDGVFLGLGPQAFAGDIGTHSRQRIKAEAAQQDLEDYNGDEGPDDTQQPWRL